MTINVKHIIFAQFALAAMLAPAAHAAQIEAYSGGCVGGPIAKGNCSTPLTWGIFSSGLLRFGSEVNDGAVYCLSDMGATSPGSPVVLGACEEPTYWKMAGNQFIDTNSNLCLEDNAGSLQISACGASTTETWSLNQMAIVNAAGGCLTVPDNQTNSGTAVQLITCNGGSNTVWQSGAVPGQIQGIGTETAGTRVVTRCLTATGSTPGSPVVIQACRKSPDTKQAWSIERSTALGFQANQMFLVDGDGLCLDATKPRSGTPLVVGTCTDPGAGHEQLWAVQ